MSWFEIYAPLGRLDTGLQVLFAIWVLTVIAGVLVWLKTRGRNQAR